MLEVKSAGMDSVVYASPNADDGNCVHVGSVEMLGEGEPDPADDEELVSGVWKIATPSALCVVMCREKGGRPWT